MSVCRRQLTFTGRVQGVGFRYRAMYKANELGLTGWVRNEWDGTVTMEVQGEDNRIEQLIFYMKRERFIQIEHVAVLSLPLVENEKSFRVK